MTTVVPPRTSPAPAYGFAIAGLAVTVLTVIITLTAIPHAAIFVLVGLGLSIVGLVVSRGVTLARILALAGTIVSSIALVAIVVIFIVGLMNPGSGSCAESGVFPQGDGSTLTCFFWPFG